MSNRNCLAPSIALKELEILLTTYDINSLTDEAKDGLFNILGILEIGLTDIAQAQGHLQSVKNHVRRMHLAADENELENAESERKSALSACAPLHEIIEQFAE